MLNANAKDNGEVFLFGRLLPIAAKLVSYSAEKEIIRVWYLFRRSTREGRRVLQPKRCCNKNKVNPTEKKEKNLEFY